MARLEKTAVYLPGNHDAVTLWQLIGEVKQWHWLSWLGSIGQELRVNALRKRLGNIMLAGYSHHHFKANGEAITVVAARPHAMGGPSLSFAPYLRRRFGVHSLAESTKRLEGCISQARTERLIFLAHNGPTGLGKQQADIWGKDFRAEGGDWGDPDLEGAVAYAKAKGKTVVAVVAGHMHHSLKFGGTRRWHHYQDSTHYINAARVPRISTENFHHYVRLTLSESKTTVEEIVCQM